MSANKATLDAVALITQMASAARSAEATLSQSKHEVRQASLLAAARLIRGSEAEILAANARDVTAGTARDLSPAFIDRLTLTPARIEDMAAGLEAIAALPDPLGAELARWQVPSGLDIARISTALGVIGIIYESRPNVTVDAAGLCIKSGNAVILRGGSDSFHSSNFLAGLMQAGLAEAGLPEGAVAIVATPDRAVVGAMLGAVGAIDVIIPRGGKGLVARVQAEARVPVFAHLEGVCHLYLAPDADLAAAVGVIVNAKMRRTGICGAAETLLVDASMAKDCLPVIADALREAGCQLRGDEAARALVPWMEPACEDDWPAEYLDAILAVRVVADFDAAIAHIARYGSGHTDAILTEDTALIERFFAEVDSAIVMANASTQFADGAEFGLGAEIGIATGKLHARGPVGAAQLTSFKYVVRGHGTMRA